VRPWSAIDENRREAWYGFLRAHADITGLLDADLRARAGLSLGVYDVLVTLGAAGDAGLRMGDLGRRVVLTPSGITRLVERLEQDGLVEREATNARVVCARLTPAGRKRLAMAGPIHREGIEATFLDHLGDDEAAVLVALWRRLAAARDGVAQPDSSSSQPS